MGGNIRAHRGYHGKEGGSYYVGFRVGIILNVEIMEKKMETTI